MDRDGTLVVDRGYLGEPEGLEFEPGAAEGLRWLYSRGYRLVVITNQSGVGRGFFPLERVAAMNARLQTMVEDAGAKLEGIYFCPHAPDAGCPCRKPALGLLTQAASELGFDPSCAVVIGDKETDVEFGRRAGAKTVLIAVNAPLPGARISPDIVASNMLQAAQAVPSLYPTAFSAT
ncbi:MAG: D-glycero-alpha-D-manno-heptose-1,7-bisphosphate 7-phosphatase [Steroidobacteraceae bacterium]